MTYILGQNISRHCNKYISPLIRRWKKTDASAYIIEPTTMNIQKFDPKKQSMRGIPLYVSRYSTRGFTIQGNKLYGSVALLQDVCLSWKVLSPADITVESLQLFTVVNPKIEILVIGTGEKMAMLTQEVHQYLKKHNIALEVLSTPHACSTYNFLIEEDRVTGAVLIPPSHIPHD